MSRRSDGRVQVENIRIEGLTIKSLKFSEYFYGYSHFSKKSVHQLS